MDNFRTDCLRELTKLQSAWPDLHCRTVKGALVVSPPPRIAPTQLSLREIAARFVGLKARSKVPQTMSRKSLQRIAAIAIGITWPFRKKNRLLLVGVIAALSATCGDDGPNLNNSQIHS